MKTSVNPVKPVRWWDWPAALLLMASMLTAATRLVATHWTEELPLVQTVTFLGVIAGLALGQSRFSPWVARVFALAYGLFIIPWQLGGILGDGLLWEERLVNLFNRLFITIDQLLQQKPVSDNIFFLLLMSSLFWAISVYAGYNLTRHARPWPAILPAGLALIIIHAYDSFFPIRTWFLAGYIFLSLLLLARLHFLDMHSRWKQNGTFLPPFVGLDSIRLGLITTAVLVLLAWTAPALASSISPAEQVWRRATMPWLTVRERLNNAFSSLQASVGVVTDFYGDTLQLGRGNPLTDTVILTVEAPPRVVPGVRYYWRQRVYDHYENGWSTTFSAQEAVSPEDFALPIPEFTDRLLVTFSFNSAYPIQNLHTPPHPVWTDRPVQAEVAYNSDGTVDLGLLKADPYIQAGDVYEVQASISAATAEQLRAAGSDYPSWITARYLQLPGNITPRTRELANQITAGLDNPYDKVTAITNYLRQNLTYSETVPEPPRGREPIDWILFDHPEAFCNYYATAEIIMLRSLGIPARMAVGYAEGERTQLDKPGAEATIVPGNENLAQQFSTATDLYTVRHRDAHAWPEVFFPGLGWIEFEPTVSQAPIFRPEGSASTIPLERPDPLEDPNALREGQTEGLENENSRNRLFGGANGPATLLEAILRIPVVFWIMFATFGLAMVVVIAGKTRQKRGLPPIPVQLEAGLRRVGIEPPMILRRWVRFATLSPLMHAYLELNRALSRLGKPPEPTDTPAERAATLSELLPVATTPIQDLLLEYQAATYGRQSGNIETAQRAGKEIRSLSIKALFQRFLARLQEPFRNIRLVFSK